jgi:hypothetical protein
VDLTRRNCPERHRSLVPARARRVTPQTINDRLGWTDEATSRAVNAEPWDPMPGMEKRQCHNCRYWFAADPENEGRRCQDCAKFGSRPASAHPP